MTTSRLFSLFLLVLMVTTLSSCAAIGDIFKAGAWVGIIGVFLVVALVWWLVTKMGGGSNNNGTSV
jgi:cytosine/uracil/thiamine/allantoin permease